METGISGRFEGSAPIGGSQELPLLRIVQLTTVASVPDFVIIPPPIMYVDLFPMMTQFLKVGAVPVE